MSNKKLSLSESLKAKRIFDDKGWKIESTNYSLYNRYINRLGKLPQETRDLFLDLTSRFDRIILNDLEDGFKKAFESIDGDLVSHAKTIYFLPLVNPKIDRFKFKKRRKGTSKTKYIKGIIKQIFNSGFKPISKSGDTICDLFSKSDYLEFTNGSKLQFPSNYEKFLKSFNPDKHLLVLVDDFIGTGDTANSVLEVFLESKSFNNKFNSKNLVVLSLISLETGINSIKDKFGVSVYQAITRKRAISDFYPTQQEVADKISLVKLMENSLKCGKEESLGYKQSEALVCILNKSPNNTLPVFWHETRNLPAPFPRRRIYRTG